MLQSQPSLRRNLTLSSNWWLWGQNDSKVGCEQSCKTKNKTSYFMTQFLQFTYWISCPIAPRNLDWSQSQDVDGSAAPAYGGPEGALPVPPGKMGLNIQEIYYSYSHSFMWFLWISLFKKILYIYKHISQCSLRKSFTMLHIYLWWASKFSWALKLMHSFCRNAKERISASWAEGALKLHCDIWDGMQNRGAAQAEGLQDCQNWPEAWWWLGLIVHMLGSVERFEWFEFHLFVKELDQSYEENKSQNKWCWIYTIGTSNGGLVVWLVFDLRISHCREAHDPSEAMVRQYRSGLEPCHERGWLDHGSRVADLLRMAICFDHLWGHLEPSISEWKWEAWNLEIREHRCGFLC